MQRFNNTENVSQTFYNDRIIYTRCLLKGSIKDRAGIEMLISIMERAFTRTNAYIGGHFINETAFKRRINKRSKLTGD